MVQQPNHLPAHRHVLNVSESNVQHQIYSLESVQRLTARLLMQYVVDTFTRLGADPFTSDIKRSIAFLAIALGTRAGSRSSEHPLRVSALAASLMMPDQTMRRQVEYLVRSGACIQVPGAGVLISPTIEARALLKRLCDGIGVTFEKLLREARALGYVPEQSKLVLRLSKYHPAPANTNNQREILASVSCELLFHILETVVGFHDNNIERAHVFHAVIAINSRTFKDKTTAWRYASAASSPSDETRQPATIQELSELTDFPFETTRRHINTLLREGKCIRVRRKGVVVPSAMLNSPEVLEAGRALTRWFIRAVARLRDEGFDFDRLARNSTSR